MKEDRLVASIQQSFIDNHLTLSVAESCTGGNLAARLTRRPGSSLYFLGSIVAYSNLMKKKVLGVKETTLEKFGAVSSQVVEEMAKGVLTLTGSDYSLAVTGIAGPGSENDQPVGTLWAAIAHRGTEPVIWNFHLQGSRQEVMEEAVETILLGFSMMIQ